MEPDTPPRQVETDGNSPAPQQQPVDDASSANASAVPSEYEDTTKSDDEIIALRKRAADAETALSNVQGQIATMKSQAKALIVNMEAKYKGQVTALEGQLAEAKSTVASLEARLSAVTDSDAQVSAAEAHVQHVTEQLAKAEARASSATARASAADSTIAKLKLEADELALKLTHAAASTDASAKAHAAALAGRDSEIAALKAAVTDRDTALSSATALAESDRKGKAELTAQLAVAKATLEAAQADTAAAMTALDAERGDHEATRRQVTDASARERALQTALADAGARHTRLEGTVRQERAEWAAERQKMADAYTTRLSDKERSASEVVRLSRQVDELAQELRQAKAALETAEAAATVARSALAAADARAAEAEGKLAVATVSARSVGGSTAKLQSDLGAAHAATAQAQARLEGLQAELSAKDRRIGDLAASLADAQQVAAAAEAAAATAAAELDVAARAKEAAQREAAEHQRKRLEAKGQLVGVAAALERERAAGTALASSLHSGVIPRLDAVADGLHNLCATLDPRYVPPPVEVDLELHLTSPIGSSGSGGSQPQHQGGGTGASSGPEGSIGGPLSGATHSALKDLLEELEGAVYTATRSAVTLARTAHTSRPLFSRGRSPSVEAAGAAGDAPPGANGVCAALMRAVGLGGAAGFGQQLPHDAAGSPGSKALRSPPRRRRHPFSPQQQQQQHQQGGFGSRVSGAGGRPPHLGARDSLGMDDDHDVERLSLTAHDHTGAGLRRGDSIGGVAGRAAEPYTDAYARTTASKPGLAPDQRFAIV